MTTASEHIRTIADSAFDIEGPLHALGARLGDKWLVGATENQPVHVAIATTAEDMDFITDGFREHLEARGHTTSVSCFWNKHVRSNDEKHISAAAPLMAQYNERHPEAVDFVVTVTSSLHEHATIATNTVRLAGMFPGTPYCVAVPLLDEDRIADLRHQFDLRDLSLPRIVPLVESVYWPDAPSSRSIAKNIRRNVEKYGRYDNTYILRYVADRVPQLTASSDIARPSL